ncbi:hypothetical protein GAB14E_3276 [Colwellia psychrerythraea]|uniref:Uncharacterized protein n=1 Tax=Colwellia psychrerythraea TaxID=28229 RepID=A0A099KK20_COLPS|nr:hypothetical protein GAB14E_3276 [Colwellia psychrerythraea]
MSPLFITTKAYTQEASEQTVLSNQVQQLLKVNSEMLDSMEIAKLSEKIIDNRQHYSNDILAKLFLLSARAASNQGDINQVYYFAQSGLASNSRDKKTKLSLLLKLAEVYIARKEYEQLLVLIQTAVNNSEFSGHLKHQLLLLSYRSVAYVMVGKHQQALADLQQVERGISQSELTEHIELLTILTIAYHQLGDYQTSLTMQLKILKLKFEMGQLTNLDQTYWYLGYAYFYLQRFDDAYNSFWESREHAENKNAVISVANANKGLGIVLLSQKQFIHAIEPLHQAIKIFKQHGMLAEQLESMVALAKARLAVGEVSAGYAILNSVIKLLDGKDISLEFAGFYRMVSEMHFAELNYHNAYLWRVKHSQVLQLKLNDKKKASSLVHGLSHLTLGTSTIIQPIEESRKLAVKLAKNSELSSSFVGKYQKQRVIIISLSALVCLLIITILAFFLRFRSQRRSLAYDEIEKPSYVIPNAMQTKFDYQLAFKKARKFQYPLSVGYLVVENWQELTFHFNDKSINEVAKDIASSINEQLSDFDYVGLLNEGEYLLLFEHLDKEEVAVKIDIIVQALNSRAFANLGGFSISMKSYISTPGFKDIDPYLFLARIAESVNISHVNQAKVS